MQSSYEQLPLSAVANEPTPSQLANGADGRDGTRTDSTRALQQSNEAAGAVVHTFSEDATPAQKAATALKAASTQNAPVTGADPLNRHKATGELVLSSRPSLSSCVGVSCG